jgi:thiamine-phosphate pyrophosphorylase
MKPWGLYAIIDPEFCKGRAPLHLARQVLQSGAGILQLRDKRSDFEELVILGRSLKTLCDEYAVPLIVNDNPYLAKEAGASGVHLGQTDMPVPMAREIVGKDALIGLSTHTRKQAIEGQISGADYLGFGPVYATSTKPRAHSPLGRGEMRWAARTLGIPFVAIGGITPRRLPELVQAGVRNVAVISAIFGADDPGAAAGEFVEGLRR